MLTNALQKLLPYIVIIGLFGNVNIAITYAQSTSTEYNYYQDKLLSDNFHNISNNDIRVDKPFIRLVPPKADTTAFFAHITCPANEALVSVNSSISKYVELHETIKTADKMQMRRVLKMQCRGGELVLKPGGLHVMFIQLQRTLVNNEIIDISLTFDSGRTIDVFAKVTKINSTMHHQ